MSNVAKIIKSKFLQSINVKNKILKNNLHKSLIPMSDIIANSILKGGKLMMCGNGGSSADAQHLAAEMLIRLRQSKNREGIPVIALYQDAATITACGNDYDFDQLYSRAISTLGSKNDVLLVLSTSGKSNNIMNALKQAKKDSIVSIGFFGNKVDVAKKYCKETFIVPSSLASNIQESHITAGHILMEAVEDKLIKEKYITLT